MDTKPVQLENPVDIAEKAIKERKRITPEHAAYRLLRDNGFSVKEAAKLVGYNVKYAYILDGQDKKYGKFALRDPKNILDANKTILAFSKGKPVNGIKPKDSVVLDAAKSISYLDPEQVPVTKTQNLNLNLNGQIDPVDLNQFKR